MRSADIALIRSSRAILCALFVMLCACGPESASDISSGPYAEASALKADGTPIYFPAPDSEEGWRSLVEMGVSPDSAQKEKILEIAGIDWDALLDAWELSENLGSGSSVIVIRNGWIAGEWGSTRKYHVASVTKSLTSLATLRMIDLSEMGRIPLQIDFDSLVHEYLPAAFSESDPEKKNIELRHLMTMSSGIRPADPDRLSMDERLHYPMDAATEAEWVYSSLPPNLLSMIIQNVTGLTYGDFFNADIASAIGVAPLRWEGIPGGFTKGAAGASISARDLARIAYLTLHNGVWNSGGGARQIVTASNLDLATQSAPFLSDTAFIESPGSPFPLPADAPNHYGYLWWTNETQVGLGSAVPPDAYYMHGFRDNLAIVVPSKNLIVIRLARRGPATDTEFRSEFMSLVMAALEN